MFLRLSIFTTLSLLAVSVMNAFANPLLEVSSGKGIIAGTAEVLNRPERLTSTTWIDLKTPILKNAGYFGGFQFGFHQSDDFIYKIACGTFRSISGERYCSRSEWAHSEGMQFFALYAGVNTDVISMVTGVEQAFRFFVGTGASRIQTYAFQPIIVPYTTLELNYKMSQSLQAKAAVFLSQLKDNQGTGISMPGITLDYYF